MKKQLQNAVTATCLLASAGAYAQVGLGEAGLAIASVMLSALLMFVLALWGFLTLLLYFVLPRFRRLQPRPGIKRATLQGFGLMLAMVALAIVAAALLQRNTPDSEYPVQDSTVAEPSEVRVPTQFVSTAFETSGVCQQRACARGKFQGQTGEALANVDYCVKDDTGQVIANGRTNLDGEAEYSSDTAGKRVAFELCWITLEVKAK